MTPSAASVADNGYRLITALFLRLLGVIYLIAFVSIGAQIEGLAGSQGILPFGERLAQWQSGGGFERWLQLPTVFWLNSSDVALQGAAIAGAVASLAIVAGRWSRAALVASFVLYLSLYHAGQLFTNFQWDGLLLEAGFLAIFLTPRSRVVILLLRWLLFRLRFMSGLAKLTMHDPTWSGLTALDSYFETQPLPNPLSWYADHLPEWLLRFGTAGTLAVELLVPLMMFLPRPWRFAAAWLTILWQVLIILTSNHNWFNFLTIALCLFLFDDRALRRVLPQRWQNTLEPAPPAASTPRAAPRIGVALLATLVGVVSLGHFRELITLQPATGALGTLLDYAEAYRVVNKYHVFPTIRTERIELQLSGSRDGREWTPYVFHDKPGDPARRPPVVIPHQPRLDWQMWFVTQHPRQLAWFDSFLQALLRNSPPVTALLEHNPFPDLPPRYIRVDAWRYRFTDAEQRRHSGRWWQREALGPFTPLPWAELRPGAAGLGPGPPMR